MVFLNKNSFFKHNIIIATDFDVYYNNDFLSEFDNVTIVKSDLDTKNIDINNAPICMYRASSAYKKAIDSLKDDNSFLRRSGTCQEILGD